MVITSQICQNVNGEGQSRWYLIFWDICKSLNCVWWL